MKRKILTLAICAALSSNVFGRDVINLESQIVDATTGEQLILTPKNDIPLVDLNTLIGATQPVTTNSTQTGLPNINLDEQAQQEVQSVPKIKYWTCGKCNPIELLIFNSQNATLIGLDNQLNAGWRYLQQNHPNLPILQTRTGWVGQRDSIASQALGQGYSNEQVIAWLIQQYQSRIKQLDQLGLIPKSQ